MCLYLALTAAGAYRFRDKMSGLQSGMVYYILGRSHIGVQVLSMLRDNMQEDLEVGSTGTVNLGLRGSVLEAECTIVVTATGWSASCVPRLHSTVSILVTIACWPCYAGESPMICIEQCDRTAASGRLYRPLILCQVLADIGVRSNVYLVIYPRPSLSPSPPLLALNICIFRKHALSHPAGIRSFRSHPHFRSVQPHQGIPRHKLLLGLGVLRQL